MSRLEPYRYSVGDHDYEDRVRFPKGQCLYTEDWRLVATDLANDFHDHHDGWEYAWPVELRIYKDNQCVWHGEVDREWEASFHVV